MSSATARSDMQQAFDADVDVSTADIGLYLVVASHDSDAMHRVLSRAGAAIAGRISAQRVLAVMRFPSFEMLRGDPSIGLIGPVSVDATRFELFQRVVHGSSTPPG